MALRLNTNKHIRSQLTKRIHVQFMSTLSEPGAVGNETESVKPFSQLPGPKNIPFLGNFLNVKAPDVGRNIKEICTIAKHMNQTYGKLVRTEVPFRAPNVFVFCPDLAEKVYRFVGPQPMRMGFQALRYWKSQDDFFDSGKGLLVSQKEEWYEFRKKVQQPMLRPKSTLRYTEVLEEVALDFINQRILKIRNDQNEMPEYFLKEMYRWALESVSCLGLNVRLGCLNPDLKEDSEQVKIINAISSIFKITGDLDDGILFWKYFPSRSLSEYMASCDIFKNTAFKYIHASLEHIKAHPTDEDGGEPTLLELFQKHGADEATSVVMALDMIFAGVDTTSHAAGFALYHLAVNPDVQEKLYKEVCVQLPHKDSRLDRKASDHMQYLKAVVKETLRMSPPVNFISRKLDKAMVLDGYELPAGTVMLLFHYVMMNNPEYVKEPNRFLPERWMKGSQHYENIHPFVALPFGHGPRMCIGRRFAEQEIQVLLMKIMQNFRLEWHHGDLPTQNETITFPTKPLKLTFIDR